MRTLLPLAIAAVLCAAGCTTTVESESPPASDSGKAPMSTTDASATAETAKCELCGSEYPKAELEMHDGKLACKACIEAHGH